MSLYASLSTGHCVPPVWGSPSPEAINRMREVGLLPPIAVHEARRFASSSEAVVLSFIRRPSVMSPTPPGTWQVRQLSSRGLIRAAAERAGYSALSDAASMEEAVHKARALAEPGDVVVLTPGCASFDMFESFEHRGWVFKDIVRSLGHR